MPGRKVAVYPNIVEKRSLAVSLDSFQACLMKLQEARLDKLPVNRHQPFESDVFSCFDPLRLMLMSQTPSSCRMSSSRSWHSSLSLAPVKAKQRQPKLVVIQAPARRRGQCVGRTVKKFLDLAWAIRALPRRLGSFGAECQSGRDIFGDVTLIMSVGDRALASSKTFAVRGLIGSNLPSLMILLSGWLRVARRRCRFFG